MPGFPIKTISFGVLALGCAGAAFATPPARIWTIALLQQTTQRMVHLGKAPPSTSPILALPGIPVPALPVVQQAFGEHLAGRPASQIPTVLTAVQGDGFLVLPPSIDTRASAPDTVLEKAAFPATPGQTLPVSAELGAEMASAHNAITLYRKGSVAEGDEFAKAVSDPVLRAALEWVAVRFDPREAGLARIRAFAADHPEWPYATWLNRRMEELTLAATHDPAAVLQRFAASRPLTLYGRLALVRANMDTGNPLEAAILIRDIWRNGEFDAVEEGTILKEFGALIGRDDHKFRADRLLYKEQIQPALRAASLAGPDVKLLALARASVINEASTTASDTAIAAVPKALANDPGLVFARIQKARRAGRIAEAADLMSSATQDPALLVNGDEWWVERRMVARKLLDLGDAKRAYAICAGHGAASDANLIEAEFHAGWIALRFLDDPKVAAVHFAKAAVTAVTPISRSRVAYWQGRAAEAAGDKDGADKFFASAADLPISFYGQLAAARLGRTAIDLRQAADVPKADGRRVAIRIVEQLYGLGERDVALPLALEIARTETADAQLGALAAVLTATGDAKATLLVGKLATQRGQALDETAFPTFGIPGYQPLGNSADRSVVYAIARQESEFDPKSVSSAGAKGLMQLIASTARQTATKYGVGYSDTRLISDAAYNAQIGAAHLGQLLAEQRGSYILTFAAYNAGSGRVQQWIEAYGDPRKPGVDPIDWIERIPFTETRNYVQRVYENMQIYRTRFGQPPVQLVGTEVAQAGKGT